MKLVRGPKPGVGSPQGDKQSPKPEVRGPRSETSNPGLGPGGANFGVRATQPEAGASGSGPRRSDLGHRALLFLLMVAALLGLYAIQRRIDRQFGSAEGGREELLYLPTESRFARSSGGYSSLLGALYWIRTVQYYGRRRLAHAQEFPLLGPLLDFTTNLDPHLLIAYRFGSLFLAGKPPEGEGDPQRAIHLLQRGIVANPDYWRLWEDLGFIYYWDLKDYAHAARSFRTGSERPGALPWMRTLAASVAARGGEYQTSRILWTEIARTAENDSIRRSAEMHLAALDTQVALTELDGVLATYQQKQGNPARSWQDLVAAGFLRGIPHDLSGKAFVLGPDGHAQLGPKTGIHLSLVQ